MDIVRLYNDYNVNFVTEGHKHVRRGWVNTECPFCTGNPGYHLSWNLNEEYFVCWRCGWHPTIKTVSAVLHVPFAVSEQLVIDYGVNLTKIKVVKTNKKEFKLPSHADQLNKAHIKYLTQRGFNAKKIIRKWKLLGTGPISTLDKIDYRFRIIIPFYWNGHIVSFDSRDITNKHQNKYQACPLDREIIEHKNILYGNQEDWTSLGICVEGPTDVWRLGSSTFATSGIKYTSEQVKVISRTFKKVVVVYDDEPQAQKQAKKLVAELNFRGTQSWNMKIKGDPGSLSNKHAKELVNYIKSK